MLAAAAGLGHPLGAAEELECWRLLPDPLQRVFANVAVLDARQSVRTVTRQRLPIGCDENEAAAPARHARLGPVAVVIGHHEQQLHAPGEAATCSRGDLTGSLQ